MKYVKQFNLLVVALGKGVLPGSSELLGHECLKRELANAGLRSNQLAVLLPGLDLLAFLDDALDVLDLPLAGVAIQAVCLVHHLLQGQLARSGNGAHEGRVEGYDASTNSGGLKDAVQQGLVHSCRAVRG